MSVVPHDIPDVGATSQRLRQNPKFDPLKAGFGTEEYFVWSRFDGATTVKDLILMTGLAIDRAVQIVRQLRRSGALLMPGETAPPTDALAATGAPTSRTVTATLPAQPSRAPTMPMRKITSPGSMPPLTVAPASSSPTVAPVGGSSPTSSSGTTPSGTGPQRTISARTATGAFGGGQATMPVTLWGSGTDAPTARGVKAAFVLPPLEEPTAEERAMHAEPGDLSLDEKTRILVGLRLVAAQDPWALVGIAPGSDKRIIKRAFFERSKLFHPDRFFGRKLGSWQLRLNTVFEAMSTAHEELIDPRAARTEESVATAPQSPTEYAAELFDRACVAELSSDLVSAVKLFAAAVKLDPIARYLRRAATCALAANELQAALDHARKATVLGPTDPSTARTLARILRALDRLDDAEEVLVMALAMKNDSDALGNELRSDLGIVRAALARRG